MAYPRINLLLFVLAMTLVSINSFSQKSDSSLPKQLATGASFSGQWFLIYQAGEKEGETFNEFTLRRGYITFSKQFNDIVSVRFTQDITLDEEGSDAGNIEMRLKYCLVHIDNKFMPFLENSWWEVGLVSRPLYSFEDKVNDYRVMGSMFLDKSKVLGSADFGVSFAGLIGGKVNEEYQKRVSSSFPGRYGSFAFGLYNGGGYHAREENSNKALEGRLTLRPLGDILPGLQLSYNFVRGKGNTPEMPDFDLNQLYITWQSRPVILAGQLYKGRGNASGSFTDDSGIPLNNKGYSLFGEIKILPTKISLISRYDNQHISGITPTDYTSFIAGVSYRFAGNSKLLVNSDIARLNGAVSRIFEAALEIRF